MKYIILIVLKVRMRTIRMKKKVEKFKFSNFESFFKFSGIFEESNSHAKNVRRTGSDGSMSAFGSAGPGFDPRRGSKFSFEIARLYITGLDSIPNPSAIYMLRRRIILLIAVRPSDGDVKPGGPLVLFEKSRL